MTSLSDYSIPSPGRYRTRDGKLAVVWEFLEHGSQNPIGDRVILAYGQFDNSDNVYLNYDLAIWNITTGSCQNGNFADIVGPWDENTP